MAGRRLQLLWIRFHVRRTVDDQCNTTSQRFVPINPFGACLLSRLAPCLKQEFSPVMRYAPQVRACSQGGNSTSAEQSADA